jgi:hypothetical protein
MGNYLKMAPYREGGAGKGWSIHGGAFDVDCNVDTVDRVDEFSNDVESDRQHKRFDIFIRYRHNFCLFWFHSYVSNFLIIVFACITK